MNELDKLFKNLGDWWKEIVVDVKSKVTEVELGMNKKQIQVELPEPPPAGGFAGCPSGDCEYEDAMREWEKVCNSKILEAIPRGYILKSSEVKEEKIVRHYADLVVEKS